MADKTGGDFMADIREISSGIAKHVIANYPNADLEEFAGALVYSLAYVVSEGCVPQATDQEVQLFMNSVMALSGDWVRVVKIRLAEKS